MGGQRVEGRVMIVLTEEKKMKHLKIKLQGKGEVYWTERKTRQRNGNTEHYTEHYTYQPYHQYHKFHPIYPLTESDPHTNECNSPLLLIFSQTFRSRIYLIRIL